MIVNNDVKRLYAVWSIAILFAVIGTLIYSNVIQNGVFLFDDAEYVLDNSLIHDASVFNLSDARQIGYLSFMINYAIGGESPVGYHLFNVVTHILNAVLVFFLARLLLDLVGLNGRNDALRRDGIAFLTGLYFLVHPVQTQAVSYITQRFTSLATLFYLTAVLSYLKGRMLLERNGMSKPGYAFYAQSLLSALLAMRTKEISFTIPLMLAFFEFALFPHSRFGRRRLIYLIPHLALLVIIPISIFGPELGIVSPGSGVAEATRKEKLFDLFERPMYQYLLTQFRVVVLYIKLLLLPIGQRAIYDLKASRSFFEPKVIASFSILTLLGAGAVLLWKRSFREDARNAPLDRAAALGIVWFFLTLSVESSVIPIKDLIFEHRIYLPSVGFLLAVSVGLTRLTEWFSKRSLDLRTITLLACIIAIPLAIGTYVRNVVWTDEILFWTDVVKKDPDKAIGYHNRGNAYTKIGEYGLALDDINKTISFFPKTPGTDLSYERADFTPSNMAKTYWNRAEIYDLLGKREEAKKDYDMARMLISNSNFDVQRSLHIANAYMKGGGYQLAIDELNKVLLWEPENTDALNDRANAYSWTKRYSEAIRDLSRIIEKDPKNALAFHNRGIAYAWSGRRGEALEDFTRACTLGFQPACKSAEEVRKGGK